MENVKRAGDLLSSLFGDHFDRISLENGRITAELYSSWAVIAKELNIQAAADHSRIREIEHNVLVIEAEHPGWVQILQTKQSQLLKLVQRKFPELRIQGISFCLSRDLISRSYEGEPLPGEGFHVEAAAELSDKVRESASGEGSAVENLHEPIKKFKKIIEKRNRGYQKTS